MRVDYRWLNEKGVCQESIDLLFKNIQTDSIDVVELADRMIGELPDIDVNEWLSILYSKLLEEVDRHIVLDLMVATLDGFSHDELAHLCEEVREAVSNNAPLSDDFSRLVRNHISEARNRYSSHSDLTSIEAYKDYSLVIYLDAINYAHKAVNTNNHDDLCRRSARVPFFIYKFLRVIKRVKGEQFDKSEILKEVWMPAFKLLKERMGDA